MVTSEPLSIEHPKHDACGETLFRNNIQILRRPSEGRVTLHGRPIAEAGTYDALYCRTCDEFARWAHEPFRSVAVHESEVLEATAFRPKPSKRTEK